MAKMVTITQDKYKELLEDSYMLNKLYAAGVDNWEGYEFAFEGEHDEDSEEDE